MAVLDRLLASSIGWVPRPIVRRVASRYVAGETLSEAAAVARRLNDEGYRVTFDLLGEFVKDEAEAERAARDYLAVLERIHQDGLDANISIKLTAFGLLLDEEATFGRVRHVIGKARELGNFVRIDMEDSACTDATLRLYRRLRAAGVDNVGLVLQAYLRRTLNDVRELLPLRPSYRLCKGIYVEPAAIAYKDPEEIRRNYREVLSEMLAGGSSVGIATHDAALIESSKDTLRSLAIPANRYEFQMLLGVTDPLRRAIVAEGHPLRVYVPFGRDWYAYSVRRLKENPRIGRYVFLALFRRRG